MSAYKKAERVRVPKTASQTDNRSNNSPNRNRTEESFQLFYTQSTFSIPDRCSSHFFLALFLAQSQLLSFALARCNCALAHTHISLSIVWLHLDMRETGSDIWWTNKRAKNIIIIIFSISVVVVFVMSKWSLLFAFLQHHSWNRKDNGIAFGTIRWPKLQANVRMTLFESFVVVVIVFESQSLNGISSVLNRFSFSKSLYLKHATTIDWSMNRMRCLYMNRRQTRTRNRT